MQLCIAPRPTPRPLALPGAAGQLQVRGQFIFRPPAPSHTNCLPPFSFCQTVLALLANCKREAKAASKELQDAAAAKEEAAMTRLAKAEKENATVYLQVGGRQECGCMPM